MELRRGRIIMQYKIISWIAPHIITDIIMIHIHSMLEVVERWSKNQNQPNQHTKDQRKGQLNLTIIDR